MKTKDVMDSLLALGLQRGKLTCQELNDALPAEFFPLEELERFLRHLEDMGVTVVDSGEKIKRKNRHFH